MTSFTFPEIPENIPHGDMPGDKICIGPEHIQKAQVIYPRLREALSSCGSDKTVAAVCGG